MSKKNDNIQNNYDAIVVGTGISGGWAAKELCEKGLKTLVLDRGRLVEHIKDYTTANMDSWDFKNNGRPTQEEIKKKEKQNRTGYTISKETSHWFVNDLEHPYSETRRFDWMRGYHVGGRSITWGRQVYRLSDLDFTANLKDGIAVDWPIRYKDIAPWYDKVEEYIGVSGEKLGLKHLPDGKFLKPMELNCLEKHIKGALKSNYKDRFLTIGRTAHISEGTKPGLGRTTCQYRSRCMRGCPFGAYFSSLSSTLPAAEKTGNMTLRPNSIVKEVVYDNKTKLATGVKVIDTISKKVIEFKAKVVFLCASTVASTSILLQSKSDRFPDGLGNDSGQLGHNIMDHHLQVGASGKYDGFKDKYYIGRRPTGIYIPRFRNLNKKTKMSNYIRGYGYQGGASRSDWTSLIKEFGYGKELKNKLLEPGGWRAGLGGFGETLPYFENKMTLDYDKLDQWGIPTVNFDAGFYENELEMRKDMAIQAAEMLEKAGLKDVSTFDRIGALGLGIHEMGTARMGRNPQTSVLGKFNQVHSVRNVYVTDGAAMTSAGCQNPSITYMALTARAANHAAEQLNKKAFS